jgi:hypothetical protein
MTNGTRISWNGDLSNEAKSGSIVKVSNGLVTISWDNGKTQVIPDFTILQKYGWKVG